MAHRVVWTEVALTDLEHILDYVIERDGTEHAARLHAMLEPAIEGLADHPTRCRVVPELERLGLRVYRELVVGPYRVPFRVRGRDVVLLAVLDGRRDLEELLIERALRSP